MDAEDEENFRKLLKIIEVKAALIETYEGILLSLYTPEELTKLVMEEDDI